MDYESIDKLKIYMQKKIDAIVTGEQVKFNINAHQLLDEINEMERKAKTFDTFLKYNQHVEKYNNSDCHELERVFQGAIKEYMEDE